MNSFIYPEIKEKDRTYGSTIISPIILMNGDWRDFLPPHESQSQNNVEPSSCYIEAQQASIATLQEATYGILDRNYTARFNALLSKGTPNGGDPIKGATSMKKDGLISQELMDWEDVNSWEDYHSWKGVDKNECKRQGKLEASIWDKKWKIVFEKDYPIEVKYANLKEALKRAPVSISVCAWYERNGLYYKPKGARDTHLVEAIYLDDKGQTYIRDTYPPYIKVIEKDTDFEFAMYWTIRKLSTEERLKNAQKSLIIKLYEYIYRLFKQAYQAGKDSVSVGWQLVQETFRG